MASELRTSRVCSSVCRTAFAIASAVILGNSLLSFLGLRRVFVYPTAKPVPDRHRRDPHAAKPRTFLHDLRERPSERIKRQDIGACPAAFGEGLVQRNQLRLGAS